MFAVEDRLADYEKWRGPAATIATASRPGVRVMTATAWAAAAAESGDRRGPRG